MNNDDGFDLGFEFDPMYLAVSEFLGIAQDVGEIQSRADKTMRSTLAGERQRIAPTVAKASQLVAADLARIEGDVRAIEASIPASASGLRIGPGAPAVPPPIPPIPEPVPPGRDIPPVVAPGGRAWIVMTTESCGPDKRMILTAVVVPYIDGQPLNPPPGSRADRVFNDLIQAQDWARQLVDDYARTKSFPCGEPASEPPSEPLPPFGCPPPACMPVCPSPEPEPPKLDYCVWYKLDPIDCIVLGSEQQDPPDASYTRERCYKTSEEAQAAADRLCARLKRSAIREPEPSSGTPPGSFCDSRTWSDGEMLEKLSSLWAQFADQAVKGIGPADRVADGASFIAEYIFPWFFSDAAKDMIAEGLRFLGGSLFDTGNAVANGSGCDNNVVGPISSVNMLFSILAKWVGNPPPRATAAMQYAEAYLCPWLLPNASEAENLYFTGVIDEQTAINLGRANGRCDDTTRLLLHGRQSRWDPTQILSLYWRGLWTRGRAASELRARGYTDDRAFEELESSSRFIPGAQDIVRFLVRDVADTGIVDRFDLDAEFGKKFDDADERIRRFSESQGIDREVLQFYWRAHWTIPSPTQLREFWQRLRPPRSVDLTRADRIGLSFNIPTWSPRSNPELRVSEEDIDAALGQQDILPYWRDKFRAVSFNPLTRVDARRAYDIGILTVSDVYESLIQDGYREEDALTLTEFATKEKNLGIRNTEAARLFSLGLASEDDTREELDDLGYSERAIVNFLARENRAKMRTARSLTEFSEFVVGNIDEPELRATLEDRFYKPEQIEELIEAAKRLGRARFRSTCTAAAKQRFLWGELSKDDARKQLVGYGWSVWSSEEIIKGWECELSVSDRLPTVRQLLNWIETGVIDVDTFRARMKRLMYTDGDVDRFLAQAIEARNIRAGKAIEKAIQEQEARIAKERAAAERARARQEREGAKASKAAQIARTTAEKLALAIQRAAVIWSRFSSLPFESSSTLLTTYVDAIASTQQLSAASATAIVVRSVEWAVENNESDLATVVDLLATQTDITADAIESK